jgi:integrase
MRELIRGTPGLYLITGSHGRQRWIFRYSRPGGKGPTEISVGHLPHVTIDQARAAVWEKRHWLRLGKDPQEVRRISQKQQKTFAEVAALWIEKRKVKWRGDHSSRLREVTNLIDVHAKPFLNMGIAHVNTDIIEAALTPLWKEHPKQMQRALAVWKSIFDFAQAKGYDIPRTNPAQWKDVFEHRLPIPTSGEEKHHAAIPFADLPAVMREIRQRAAVGAVALEFIILTACRTNEALGMQWSEIDWEQRIWTKPWDRTRAGRVHRVPLSDQAIALLVRQKECSTGSDFVFTGYTQKPLAHGQPLDILQSIVPGATTHGTARSCFRDWGWETTTFPRELLEECLSHRIGSKTELAYRRGDALEKRREIMDAWAAFVSGD